MTVDHNSEIDGVPDLVTDTETLPDHVSRSDSDTNDSAQPRQSPSPSTTDCQP